MKHDLQVTIIKELMAQLDAGKNVDSRVQYKMPTESYVPDIAARERKLFEIIHSLSACQVTYEAGSYLTLEDFGVPILATRDKTGQFDLLNACRHRSVKWLRKNEGQKRFYLSVSSLELRQQRRTADDSK